MTEDDKAKIRAEFWQSPIASAIGQLYDDGADFFIWGIDPTCRFAMLVFPDHVTVMSTRAVTGSGSWETTRESFDDHREMYAERYPVRA